MAAEEADNPTGAAGAYGVANWFLYNGDMAEARRRMEALTNTAGWDSFGYIAAEADLAMMERAASGAASRYGTE
jgi:hypothetical protein